MTFSAMLATETAMTFRLEEAAQRQIEADEDDNGVNWPSDPEAKR
jgi:hypothetical protein